MASRSTICEDDEGGCTAVLTVCNPVSEESICELRYGVVCDRYICAVVGLFGSMVLGSTASSRVNNRGGGIACD